MADHRKAVACNGHVDYVKAVACNRPTVIESLHGCCMQKPCNDLPFLLAFKLLGVKTWMEQTKRLIHYMLHGTALQGFNCRGSIVNGAAIQGLSLWVNTSKKHPDEDGFHMAVACNSPTKILIMWVNACIQESHRDGVNTWLLHATALQRFCP